MLLTGAVATGSMGAPADLHVWLLYFLAAIGLSIA
jgi:hypothetical protein